MIEMDAGNSLHSALEDTLEVFHRIESDFTVSPSLREYGVVTYVGPGVARVRGLPRVQSEELVRFEGGVLGMTFNLDPEDVGVILLDDAAGVDSGSEVRRTNRVLDTPVGEGLLGRVVDPLGRPLEMCIRDRGLTSLYNLSLGTTTDEHLYDRVEERDSGPHSHPWDKKAVRVT